MYTRLCVPGRWVRSLDVLERSSKILENASLEKRVEKGLEDALSGFSDNQFRLKLKDNQAGTIASMLRIPQHDSWMKTVLHNA